MLLLHLKLIFINIFYVASLNLDYLDPTKLQTKTLPKVQEDAAIKIINKYSNNVNVEVNPLLFGNKKKDVFLLRSSGDTLNIRASTGVAAVWGFNYYLKKYCKSQIAWQVQRVSIPSPLPEVDEIVVANDRFRYYQNVCTASYSFVWWTVNDWLNHVEWMALNGINLALAPVAQEYIWTQIYQDIGMTDDEINNHFSGPAFLSWLRMGNMHGWSGPLLKSWHDLQRNIQDAVVSAMFELGMVPVLPAFNGHVPRAFERIYSNTTFYSVKTWNKFEDEYCCNLFLHPKEYLFNTIGKMFLQKITSETGLSHVYTADPFNEIIIEPWSTMLVQETAHSIYSTITEVDNNAVWLLQNWMFVHNPLSWPLARVQTFLTTVPNGRMLILDLQSEQWPQYDVYDMYYGQPFIWCMLHNFGGTLGMFGNMKSINKNVYEVRDRVNSTMIGIGLTPEGINQNYVVYDLMLESAWRKSPVQDLKLWVGEYAERRYGCNDTASAWRYLLKSVYNFDGLNRIRGKYVVTRRPSFKIRPWAWYSGHDIFEALKRFVFISENNCRSDGFYHDLVDITRQALQYRSDQLYHNIINEKDSSYLVFNTTITRFLDIMTDMEIILSTNDDFSLTNWLSTARNVAASTLEGYLYEMNARNQITLWGPNGEITDYACKQWTELFHYYYIPRWSLFLNIAADAKLRNETFNEKTAQQLVRSSVEEQFLSVDIRSSTSGDTKTVAAKLYEKWAFSSGLEELPRTIIRPDKNRRTTLADTDLDNEDTFNTPEVLSLYSTTPN